MQSELPALSAPLWCEIPGTDQERPPVTLGGDPDAYEPLPAQTVALPTFEISTYPVTHGQFQPFIDAGGFDDDQWWEPGDDRTVYPQLFPISDHPRDSVTWYAAMAYCRWLSASLGYPVRLPTEVEWEKAARGEESRIFPWGNRYTTGDANINETKDRTGPTSLGATSAVGQYGPLSASPYGVMDMAGNVWEWTLTPFEIERKRRRLSRRKDASAWRVLRGGSWADAVRLARAASRHALHPADRYGFVGFRLVRDTE